MENPIQKIEIKEENEYSDLQKEKSELKDEIKDDLKTEIKEEIKDDDNVEYEFDVNTFEKVSSIVTAISQQKLSEYKSILIENEKKGNNYIQKNPFIKEAFDSIYDFIFKNVHLSEHFSSFFAFKDILGYIKTQKIYKLLFGLDDEILTEKILLLKTVLEGIIKDQMQKKKTKKNRKVNQKRKERELRKKMSEGVIDIISKENKPEMFWKEKEPFVEKQPLIEEDTLKEKEEKVPLMNVQNKEENKLPIVSNKELQENEDTIDKKQKQYDSYGFEIMSN